MHGHTYLGAVVHHLLQHEVVQHLPFAVVLRLPTTDTGGTASEGENKESQGYQRRTVTLMGRRRKLCSMGMRRLTVAGPPSRGLYS